MNTAMRNLIIIIFLIVFVPILVFGVGDYFQVAILANYKLEIDTVWTTICLVGYFAVESRRPAFEK